MMKQTKKVIKETIALKPFYKGYIPSDWETPTFGEVFEFLKSYAFSREQLTDRPTDTGIQNIHYGDIHATFKNEVLDLEREKQLPFVKVEFLSSNKSKKEIVWLEDGDLIIADASEDIQGIATCVELRNVKHRKIISGLHTFAVRDNKGMTAPGFRTYILNHPQVIRELRRIATGISVFSISKANLQKVKIPLPPLPEQKLIATLLLDLDEESNLLYKKQELLRLKKFGLIQQLLTGKMGIKSNG